MSMVNCKKDVTPVRWQSCYVFLALTHRFDQQKIVWWSLQKQLKKSVKFCNVRCARSLYSRIFTFSPLFLNNDLESNLDWYKWGVVKPAFSLPEAAHLLRKKSWICQCHFHCLLLTILHRETEKNVRRFANDILKYIFLHEYCFALVAQNHWNLFTGVQLTIIHIWIR